MDMVSIFGIKSRFLR